MSRTGGPDDDAAGEAPRRGQRQHRRGSRRGSVTWRVTGGLAIGLVVLLVASCLGVYVKYRGVWSSIHRIKITGLGQQPPKYNDALNILLIGSDSRAGQNRQFGAGIRGQRSDTIMLLHISPGHHHATVVSIPRDTMVPVIGCPREGPGAPSQSAAPGQRERVNQAYSSGGPGCLWATVEQQTGVHLDHFIALTFTGFEHIINDIGGVSICLPVAVDDPDSGLDLPAGQHHVMGAQALAFWRERHIGLGSDLQRIRRDQYLMAAIVRDVAHGAIARSPARLYSVVRDTASAMTTDTGLDQATLLTITESLRGLSSKSVQFITAPEVPYPADPQAEVEFAQPQARGLFTALARDRALPRAAPGSSPPGHRAGQDAAARPAPSGSALNSAPPRSAPRRAAPARAASQAPGPGRRTAPVGGLAKSYGGITATAPSCGDQAAFSGGDTPSDFSPP